MTACFTSASVANRLLATCFLRGSKCGNSLGPIMSAWLVEGYSATAGTYWSILSTAPILRSEISIYLDPLRRIRLASDLQQKPTWSKTSHPGYIQLIWISSTTPGYKFWYHGRILPICQWWLGLHLSMVCTICYTLQPTYLWVCCLLLLPLKHAGFTGQQIFTDVMLLR